MPGMGQALNTDNETIVSAFRSALLHQGLVVLAILAVLALSWNVLRAFQLRRGVVAASSSTVGASEPLASEPPARRLLRVAFGLLWILDGVLQGQVSMPLGMPSQVVTPAAAGAPSWVHHLVAAGVTIWSDHPITAAASVVWIQVGIGILLIAAPRGRWSRAAGLASVAWALVVWVFGEAFGGIFTPGLSWMFGAPGAVVLYGAAGACVALPERVWTSLRAGRTMLASVGAFFVGMAVLQAWPGRGFWTGAGRDGRGAGELTTMVREMSRVPQPAIFASWLRAFASFDRAHGFAVNLVVVLFLAVSGVALASGRARAARIGVLLSAVICTADWILVQDFGFFGGVGTDPNSMVPMLVVIVAGYVALVRVPVLVEEPTVFAPAAAPGGAGAPAAAVGGVGVSWRARLASNPTYAFRSLAALGALGIVVLGAAPMAAASVNPNADAIVSQATDGNVNFTDSPAASFQLTDQYGQPVSLADLHGRTLAITFLDPVCTVDCPIIAQEFREADTMLGAQAREVDFVAVVANPLYRSVEATRAFDSAEGLSHIGNWLFLTGSLRSLEHVWNSYGVQVAVEPGGAMIAHSDLAYVIDGSGDVRAILDADPGPGTASSKSSFAGVLASTVRQVLPAS